MSYISRSCDFALYLEDYLSYFRSINRHDPTFNLKINVGHCDLYFVVQWLCLMPWRLFHVWASLFGIMNKYDLMHHLEINVGHRDLYVTIQWFCLVSWRLFQVWTSLFGILNQYDPTHLLKINVGHCDLYFMVQWFCYILKTIWCMNIILGDCRSIWPVVWLPN